MAKLKNSPLLLLLELVVPRLFSFLYKSPDAEACDDDEPFCNEVPAVLPLPLAPSVSPFEDELNDPDEFDLEINVLVDELLDLLPDDTEADDEDEAAGVSVIDVEGALALTLVKLCCDDDKVDDDDDCGFFEAGPLLTPGFRPVCVFGELEPLLEPDADE